jgi:hypothetical protein
MLGQSVCLLLWLFLEAIRVKYRLSHDGYRRYYTNTLRIKLSRFLYDEGTRKLNKTIKQQRRTVHHQHTQRQVATTTELFQEPDISITTKQNSYSHFDQEQ